MKNNGNEDQNSPQRQKKDDEKRKKSGKKNLWPLTALVITLFLSFIFSLISELVLGKTHLAVAYVLVLLLIVIAVIFDMIGVSATSCDIQPFLSMSARKVKGAKTAVKLVQNASKVSSICADIIGDICGIVSGACAAVIVITQFGQGASLFISVLFSAIVAALTVFGKALGKAFAIKNANKIIFVVARVLSVFKKN